MTRPYLKWAGGKYELAPQILALLPKRRRYIEPFCGSCAVALQVQAEEKILGDRNLDLIHLHRMVTRELPIHQLKMALLFVPHKNQEQKYYQRREMFNRLPQGDVWRVVLFLYLMRHGYNGLCRYNQQGNFNAPYGHQTQAYFPEQEMGHFARTLLHAQFHGGDYEGILLHANRDTVVYCDPPYVPTSETADFTSYDGGGGWGSQEQERLVREARWCASKRGAVVAISNSDTPFTRALYADADQLHELRARRRISSDPAKRGYVTELLAIYGSV